MAFPVERRLREHRADRGDEVRIGAAGAWAPLARLDVHRGRRLRIDRRPGDAID